MPATYNNNNNNNNDFLQIEPHVVNLLIDKLKPEDSDVIIIGSDNESLRAAEFAAKNAALYTITNHETHKEFTN
jgi:hypothetical protein